MSWIRKSDGYLLTVERDTFIGDNRFEALHLAASDTWTLHIRNVRPDDAGVYECQVSSEPKTSQLFTLHIISESFAYFKRFFQYFDSRVCGLKAEGYGFASLGGPWNDPQLCFLVRAKRMNGSVKKWAKFNQTGRAICWSIKVFVVLLPSAYSNRIRLKRCLVELVQGYRTTYSYYF